MRLPSKVNRGFRDASPGAVHNIIIACRSQRSATAMMTATSISEIVVTSIIGLDLAKNVFEVQGGDVAGSVVVRRQLRRSEVIKFFASLPASSGWKRARRLTSGRVLTTSVDRSRRVPVVRCRGRCGRADCLATRKSERRVDVRKLGSVTGAPSQ